MPNTYMVVTFPAFGKRGTKGATAKSTRKARHTAERDDRERTMKSLYDWLKRNRLENVGIHVDENPSRGGIGLHTNILIHLPVSDWKRLRDSLFQCLRKTAHVSVEDCPDGNPTGAKRKAIHILPASDKMPMDSDNALRALQYILKGTDPSIEVINDNQMPTALIDIPGIRLDPQGDVRRARRVGVSMSISNQTRSKDPNWEDDKSLSGLWKNRGGKKTNEPMPLLPIDIDIKAVQEALGGADDEDAGIVLELTGSPYSDPDDPEWGVWS